jgi:hypothetical protein
MISERDIFFHEMADRPCSYLSTHSSARHSLKTAVGDGRKDAIEMKKAAIFEIVDMQSQYLKNEACQNI